METVELSAAFFPAAGAVTDAGVNFQLSGDNADPATDDFRLTSDVRRVEKSTADDDV